MDIEKIMALRRELEDQQNDQQQARLEELLGGLAEVISAADRSLACQTSDPEALHSALSAVRGQLVGLLHRQGVALLGAVNEPIDPDRHHVIQTVDGPASDLPRITQIACYGLVKNDEGLETVLRKAEVIATAINTDKEHSHEQ